eukprot:114899_1
MSENDEEIAVEIVVAASDCTKQIMKRNPVRSCNSWSPPRKNKNNNNNNAPLLMHSFTEQSSGDHRNSSIIRGNGGMQSFLTNNNTDRSCSSESSGNSRNLLKTNLIKLNKSISLPTIPTLPPS